MNLSRLGLAALSLTTLYAACEVYDPPPTVTLEIPVSGKWESDTPLTLAFSEPIDQATFRFTIWPFAYGPEGEIAADAEPLAAQCGLDASSCAELGVAFNEGGDEVVLDHGTLFAGQEGIPFILEVHEGLKDLAGRERKVPTIFEFQISPTQSEGAVEVNLNSGVLVMVSDLSSAIPGVYLRLFTDLVVDETTGKTWIAGTVANLDPSLGLPTETTDPTAMQLYDDPQGWTVAMEATISSLPDGKLFLRTQAKTVTVNVLGFIWVQLQDFQFEATIEPGAGPDGRDIGTGLMTSSKALMNGPEDPDDLGEVASALVMTGVFAEEVPVELPQLCEEDPCEHMNAAGGDCQLADPWEKVPACP